MSRLLLSAFVSLAALLAQKGEPYRMEWRRHFDMRIAFSEVAASDDNGTLWVATWLPRQGKYFLTGIESNGSVAGN